VLPGDKGKPDRLGPHGACGKCDLAKRKRSGRGSGKRVALGGEECAARR